MAETVRIFDVWILDWGFCEREWPRNSKSKIENWVSVAERPVRMMPSGPAPGRAGTGTIEPVQPISLADRQFGAGAPASAA